VAFARKLAHGGGAAAFAAHGLWRRASRPPAPLPLPPELVRRILVIRLDLLGDAVFTVPTVRAAAAAFPAASIDVLALPYASPLFRRLKEVREVIELDVNRYRRPAGWLQAGTLARVLWRLRRRDYDLALGVSGLMGGVFGALSGARWSVGFGAETYWGCHDLSLPGRRYTRARHEVEYGLALVRFVTGLDPWQSIPPPSPSVADPRAHAAEDRYAVLVPGASNGSAKRWPGEYWAALGDRLALEHGLRVVLAGAASERGLAGQIAARMSCAPEVAAGRTSVAELIALLEGARIVVAGDTGPLHVASALGRPVVGIYGPTDPLNTGPLAPRSAVVRLGLACSPCYDLRSPADCKLPDRSVRCMWGLHPERVYAAVSAVLADEDVPVPGSGGRSAAESTAECLARPDAPK
jgi:ADP-heptose:LPS heptosyltransferase